MRVLMFRSSACTADPRVYSEARSLIKAGNRVTVIAWDREGTNRPRQDWDGIEVVRLRTRLLPGRYRAGSPFWVGFNLLLWQSQAYRLALKLNKEGRFDVIHCNDFDTLRVGLRLKRKLGLPLVYDAYEIYGYMIGGSVPGRIASLFLWLEKRLVRRADAMITDGEGRRRYFAGIVDRPISVVMNCKPLQSSEYEPPQTTDGLALLYIGTLWPSRMLVEVIEAARELAGVRCLIGGVGQPDYVRTLREECARTSNVAFLGEVPFEEVIPMTKRADVVICMLSTVDDNVRLGMPNKLGEAMVCGRPVISSRGTYSGEIIEEEQVGLVVDNTVAALREAMMKLRDDPALRERLGRNALKAAINKYNWEKQEEGLLKLYESLRVNSK